MSLNLSILQIRFTSSGKVTETSIWPLATDLSELQAEWPRFLLLPFVFPVLPLFVFLLKFLFISATASFCRLAASLMFAICFCSSRFFFEVSLFLGRVAILVIREVSRLFRGDSTAFSLEGILCNRQLHVSKS